MKQNMFVKWAKNKYTEKQRLVAMIPLGLLFVVIIPYFLVWTSSIDKRLGIPSLIFEPLNLVIGIVLAVAGLIFGFWSNQSIFQEGKGTPAPIMPTRKLVLTGPYRYCRNPMAFGAILYYLGIVILTGSISSFGLWLILTMVLLISLKCIEEKELQARFGQEYLEYKKKVPFIIPRIYQEAKDKKG
jgi:protein-S-isoprenylcysteine O-methyltransferase Ste14